MPSFSRRTIIEAVATLDAFHHADLDRFMLEHGLENTGADAGSSVGLKKRANTLMAYLLANPEVLHHEGGNLTERVVRDLIQGGIARAGRPTSWNLDPFEQMFPALSYALKRDGFQVRGRPAPPRAAGGPGPAPGG